MDFSDIRRVFRLDLSRPRIASDVSDEVRFHLERRIEELVAAGLSPEQARGEALRAFGDVGRVSRELVRIDRARAARVRRRDWLSGVAGDVRFALRALRRAPAFTAVALLTLAIGIGATAGVFSVVRAVLLRTLPYPNPEALVRVQELDERGEAMDWASANFYDVQSRARSVSAMAMYAGGETTVLGGDEPVRAQAVGVMGDFFEVLGVPAAVGRTFSEEERAAGGPPAVVVSHGFWQRVLGGGDPHRAPDDQLLRIGGRALRVVGVMPAGFAFPAGAELWVASHDPTPSRTAHNESGIARLAPGRTVEQARAELSGILADIKAREGDGSDAVGAYVMGLHEELAAPARDRLLLLQGAVVLVLLLACVNIAAASLARGEARHRELAVRAAIGAGRGRLARLLLVESVMLGIAGGALGLLLAAALTRLAASRGSAALPGYAEPKLDLWVAGIACVTAVAAGILVGLLPAWRAARTDLRAAIGDGGRSGAPAGARRARGALVGTQVALAFALLVAATLLVRSLDALLSVDPGFGATRVLTADVGLPGDLYADSSSVAGYYERLLPALRALPGVEEAGLVSTPPLAAVHPTSLVYVDGASELSAKSVAYRVASPGYFAAMRIPLRRGRLLTDEDRPGAPHAIVVSEEAARRLWPGEDPIGRRVRFPGMDQHRDVWLTVVGVVGDVRHFGLEAPPTAETYISYRQRPQRVRWRATIVLRGPASAGALGPAVREVVRAQDPNVPVTISSMQEALDRSVAPRRLTAAVLVSFGGVALLLAALGLYGVLAYSVAQRRRELSVRLALGAAPADLRRMVLADAARAVVPGIAVGVLGALALARAMRSLLFGVSAVDPVALLAAAAVLLAATVLASYIPAWRATRSDPLLALRGE